MKGRVLFFTAIALYIAYHWGLFGFGSLPSTSSIGSAADDPCIGKKRCVVAYVAPWCPACRNSVPFLNLVSQKVKSSSQVAMKVIVGADEPAKLREMAKEYTAPTFLDEEGRFASEAGVHSYPSIWVIDDKGQILRKNLPGSISGGADENANFEYYNQHYLKLEGFL